MGSSCGCEDHHVAKDGEGALIPMVPEEDQDAARRRRAEEDAAAGATPHGATVALLGKGLDGGAGRSSRKSGQPRTFEVFVHKTGLDDKLGMDVKHICGKLEVVQIFPNGAVERANRLNTAKSPPGETVQLGDVIHRVNDVDENDHKMVAECRLKDDLTFSIARPS